MDVVTRVMDKKVKAQVPVNSMRHALRTVGETKSSNARTERYGFFGH
jgi:hypothetical protein